MGSNLTSSIMAGLVQKTPFEKDPRAALLKYHDEKGMHIYAIIIFISKSFMHHHFLILFFSFLLGLKEMDIYKKTQPVPIFQKPLEEGEEGDRDALGRT